MSEAEISWIGGPVLRARVKGTFRVGEAIEVGPRQVPGEVIRLRGDELVAQVYEDTTGLRPGDRVRGIGRPLSIRLGPGLLGHIFDGLLRPLDRAPARDENDRIDFRPLVKVGDRLAAGGAFGEIPGEGIRQRCLAPPDLAGTVERIVEAGRYSAEVPLCTIRTGADARREIGFFHNWPIRDVRPARERLPSDEPMITGQRILDTLFPVARGGRATLPGGFGTGKTVLQEALAKWCDADVIVYVGCGERGNEMAEVLDEFPQLEDPRSGRPLAERTVIIANTSNMPVAAREASIYTAISVAEYFRDQGLHVALMADSTSRWAEALREVSGRLGELPGEAGYPAYLSSRLAEFYERAARVKTLSGQEGSVTIIGAVSPPAGDFSEPVTLHTKRYVRCFWALDSQRAQARFYPAIHPLQSYSADADALASWWKLSGNPDWMTQRQRVLALLEQQSKSIVDNAAAKIQAPGWQKKFREVAAEDVERARASALDWQRTQRAADLETQGLAQFQRAVNARAQGAHLGRSSVTSPAMKRRSAPSGIRTSSAPPASRSSATPSCSPSSARTTTAVMLSCPPRWSARSTSASAARRQLPGMRAWTIAASFTSLLRPSLHSRKTSPSATSAPTASSSSTSSPPSARVITLAGGRSSVASDAPACSARTASSWLWSRVSWCRRPSRYR